MDSVGLLLQSPVSDVLTLARRFEPVLRYTQGELFSPMAVERYVEASALFRRVPNKKLPELVAPSAQLDLSTLITYAGERGASDLELHFVDKPLNRAAYRRWRRRPDRPRFHGGSPFAMVGMFGRVIDSIMRLSLIMRGKVPGGFAAAANVRFQEAGDPAPTYYVHAVRDAGYLVLQYWFFYAMNDWRSTFGGVNDHEGDWEQITLFLTEADSGQEPELAWVAFSAHDEVGDDLRRRIDDPDLELIDGTHPVVYAGAGSHSGAYLPGDYIVTVAPPAVEKLTQWWRRSARAIMPARRTRERAGIGLPFVDYRRGDGPSVGPGTQRTWTPVVIDDETPWVQGYRGLWGYDTRDPFGGERAPAGPRYERNGSVRRAWDRPAAWAGLDKVPPTPTDEVVALQQRAGDIDVELDAAETRLADDISRLRSRHEGQRALALAEGSPTAVAYVAAQTAVDTTRDEIAGLMAEQRAISQALVTPSPPDPVHAHLRHRALPDQDVLRPTRWTLRFWASISVSVLLLAVAALIMYGTSLGVSGLIGTLVVVAGIEASIRGRVLSFLIGLVIIILILIGIYLAVTNIRVAIAGALVLAAFALLLSNLLGYLRRR